MIFVPSNDLELFWLACGTALGLVVGWLLTRLGAGPELNYIRRELAKRDSELNSLGARHEQTQLELAAVKAGYSRDAELASQREAWLAQARETLLHSFNSLAGEALQMNNTAFLREASSRFEVLMAASGHDLAQRQESVRQMVQPLELALTAYQQQLQQAELQQAEAMATLRAQIAALTEDSNRLANQTQQLRLILSSNQARGRWGEETLRRVVEAAGMSPHSDFVEQASAASDDGRPDLIVNLPHDKKIIVDAKVPDLSFLDSAGGASDDDRRKLLQQHASSVRETIKRLAAREYTRQFEGALDHVILFFPAESLFSAALEADPELIIWASSRKILLATPASLIGLLRAVALSWRQYDQDRNARFIADAARELYKRMTTMLGHMEEVRGGLERAVRGFNQMARSYETRVRPQGERLLAYGVDPGASTEPPSFEELNMGLEDLSQRNLL